jgi:hypothetical protein
VRIAQWSNEGRFIIVMRGLPIDLKFVICHTQKVNLKDAQLFGQGSSFIEVRIKGSPASCIMMTHLFFTLNSPELPEFCYFHSPCASSGAKTVTCGVFEPRALVLNLALAEAGLLLSQKSNAQRIFEKGRSL